MPSHLVFVQGDFDAFAPISAPFRTDQRCWPSKSLSNPILSSSSIFFLKSIYLKHTKNIFLPLPCQAALLQFMCRYTVQIVKSQYSTFEREEKVTRDTTVSCQDFKEF